MPDRALVWRVGARDDLAKIILYIAERDLVAARRMHALIENAVSPLVRHLFLFRAGRVAGTREVMAHPNYIVVYRVTDDTVEIVNVLHARRQYP